MSTKRRLVWPLRVTAYALAGLAALIVLSGFLVPRLFFLSYTARDVGQQSTTTTLRLQAWELALSVRVERRTDWRTVTSYNEVDASAWNFESVKIIHDREPLPLSFQLWFRFYTKSDVVGLLIPVWFFAGLAAVAFVVQRRLTASAGQKDKVEEEGAA